jgi:hydroxyethylthiazole kinase-like uncharacterized protein yjeF
VQPLHTIAEIRTAEQVLLDALPEGALMARAATGLAVTCARLLRERCGRLVGASVLAVVGAGNNGGDALFAAAALAGRGVRVVAVLLNPDRAHPAGLAALRRARGRIAPAAELAALAAHADLVLDGIVGIGATGALHGPAAAAVRILNEHARFVVAVDLPSGIDSDTGEAPGAHVNADATVTFGARKPGLFIDPGAGAAGLVEVVDIGLGPHLPGATTTLVDDADLAALPQPDRESQKYTRGVLGLHAGSAGYPGAAVLSTAGALAGPIGMVRFVGPDDVSEAVIARFPEVVAGTGQVQAHAIGPGLGTDRGAEVRELVASGLPVLVDADGLNALPDRLPDDARVLLTPHAGELARLLHAERADVEARRLEHARRAATARNATVLLKGTTTVVVHPDGRVRVSTGGTPYLATAGAGDVLSGFAGALLAAGLEALEAGAVGAYAHGHAARRAAGDPPRQLVAAEVAAALPATVAASRG